MAKLEFLKAQFKYWRQAILRGFKIGIAGHPDGSPDISDSNLEKAYER